MKKVWLGWVYFPSQNHPYVREVFTSQSAAMKWLVYMEANPEADNLHHRALRFQSSRYALYDIEEREISDL